jgi:hypothetical protein
VYFGTGKSVLKKWETQIGTPSKQVLVLVSPDGIALEGKPTTWEELPGLLEKLNDRPQTVLAFAFTTDQMNLATYYDVQRRLHEFAKKYGFKYVSDTGIHRQGADARPKPLDLGKEKITFWASQGKVHMHTDAGDLEMEKLAMTVANVGNDARLRTLEALVADGKVHVTVEGIGEMFSDRVTLSGDGKLQATGGVQLETTKP